MVRRQKGVHGTYIYRPPGTAVPASDDQSGISDIQGKINILLRRELYESATQSEKQKPQKTRCVAS